MGLTDLVWIRIVERVVVDYAFKIGAGSQPSASHEDYVSEWLVEFGRPVEQVANSVS